MVDGHAISMTMRFDSRSHNAMKLAISIVPRTLQGVVLRERQ